MFKENTSNREKGLESTQQVCATSIGQKLCCTVHLGDNFHDTFLATALCVVICQCTFLLLRFFPQVTFCIHILEKY